MNESTSQPGVENPKAEFVSYVKGGVLAVGLTLIAFGLVGFNLVSGPLALGLLAGLAVIQIVVHFVYFMHIDLKESHRDLLQLILFTALIVAIMVGGTIWILFDQWLRMM